MIMQSRSSVLHCSAISKSYREGGAHLVILSDVNLAIAAGEKVAVVGTSGAGKTTLLNMLGGLDKPDSGDVAIMGQSIVSASARHIDRMRNQHLGFVYQLHHLLAEFSALENVMMPCLISGDSRSVASEKALHILKKVGLQERQSHRPSQLSGGERQRVAIARALVHQPACVLMDEPTGNLDPANAEQVFQLILEISESVATSFVIVTHDMALAKRMDRVLVLADSTLQDAIL